MYEKLQGVTPSSSVKPEELRSGVQEVLVVDDNDAFRGGVAELLAAAGFRVVTANGAEHALKHLAQQTPDLIICDVMMPGMDGYQLHEAVQSSELWCRIPFLFLTTQGNLNDVRRGKALGCDDYLIKPIDPEDLLAVVRGKLVAATKRQEAKQHEIGQFRKRVINTLSHEFRTPLVAIHTGAELLLHQPEVQEVAKVRKLIEAIYRGGNRLERLVSDFMTLQQINNYDSQQIVERLRSQSDFQVITNLAIENFVQTYSSCDGNEVPQVRFEDSGKELWIRVLEPQVVDTIERLLSNAYKFGGKQNAIEISLRYDQHHAQLRIRDSGPGMTEDGAKEACDPFVQIDRDKLEQQGCGLGLTIAKHYAQLNGGSLTFENHADGGLIVTLSFPLLDPKQLVETSSN